MSGRCARIVGAIVALLMSAAMTSAEAAAESIGNVQIRVTDHRPGISDFRWLKVSFDAIALHRKGEPRLSGWVEVATDGSAIDIVPLKDGRWQAIAERTVPAGRYDAVRVLFGPASGELQLGGLATVTSWDTTVGIDFDVQASGGQRLVLDLFAEDQTDHQPRRYVVKVKDVRLGE